MKSKISKSIILPLFIASVISTLHVSLSSQGNPPPVTVCGGVGVPNYPPNCGPRLSNDCKKKTCSGELGEIEYVSCCKQKTPAPPQGRCIQVYGKWCCQNNQWVASCREIEIGNTCDVDNACF